MFRVKIWGEKEVPFHDSINFRFFTTKATFKFNIDT